MRIKLVAIILFMVFIAVPVFAQNQNGVGNNRNANATSTAGAEGKEKNATSTEKSKAIREDAINKKENAGQLKNKAANEHRSAVANFVQSLLDVADRQALGGIGEQVREIAKQQNDSEEKVTSDLEKVKNKNQIRKFLFGTDFGATKEIKKEMQDATKRLNELKKIKGEVVNLEDKAILEEQIKNFQEEINNVLTEVKNEEGKFSLFGWAKKLFI